MLRQSCWQLIAFLNCPVLAYCKFDLSTHSERMDMVFKNWNIWIAFCEALDVSEKPRFDLQCELEGIKANSISLAGSCRRHLVKVQMFS